MWMLGLSMILMVLGGLSMDLWRVLGERRLLASVADSAAVAAASALDLESIRAGAPPAPGERVPLERAAATERALLVVEFNGLPLSTAPSVAFLDGDTLVEVFLQSEVEFGLLRLLVEDGSFTVTATANATATEFD